MSMHTSIEEVGNVQRTGVVASRTSFQRRNMVPACNFVLVIFYSARTSSVVAVWLGENVNKCIGFLIDQRERRGGREGESAVDNRKTPSLAYNQKSPLPVDICSSWGRARTHRNHFQDTSYCHTTSSGEFFANETVLSVRPTVCDERAQVGRHLVSRNFYQRQKHKRLHSHSCIIASTQRT